MIVKVPFITSNEEEVTVVKIYVKPNSYVKKKQKLFEIETTKTSVEIESINSGYIFFDFDINHKIQCGEIFYEINKEQKKKNKKNILVEKKIITKDAKKIINKFNIDLNNIKEKIISTDVLKKYINQKTEIKKFPIGKKNGVLIVGCSSHGATVYDYLLDEGKYLPQAFVNYSDDYFVENFLNLDVFSVNDLKKIYENGITKIFINTNNYRTTQNISKEAEKIGYELINVVHKTAWVSKRAVLGKSVFIGPNSLVGTNANVGSYSKILNSASIAHDTSIGEHVQVSDGCIIAGNCNIGDRCLFGINSSVINNCKIGSDVTVVSGKTVTKNLGNGIIYNE